MESSPDNKDLSVTIANHPVVSREEWLAARKKFLNEEKEFTRLRAEHSKKLRALPWVKVDKEYVFDAPGGRVSLAQLFDKRSQLIVYHFMFNPQSSEGCKHCSFWADHFDASGIHLNHRDVTMVAISRASLEKIEAFKQRMGWHFKWVSSAPGDFNYDFHASFTPEQIANGTAMFNYAKAPAPGDREGFSVFYKDEAGVIYHTYSCFARGIDVLNGTYHLLDMVPKGRDEAQLKAPQAWVKYHDRYEA